MGVRRDSLGFKSRVSQSEAWVRQSGIRVRQSGGRVMQFEGQARQFQWESGEVVSDNLLSG